MSLSPSSTTGFALPTFIVLPTPAPTELAPHDFSFDISPTTKPTMTTTRSSAARPPSPPLSHHGDGQSQQGMNDSFNISQQNAQHSAMLATSPSSFGSPPKSGGMMNMSMGYGQQQIDEAYGSSSQYSERLGSPFAIQGGYDQYPLKQEPPQYAPLPDTSDLYSYGTPAGSPTNAQASNLPPPSPDSVRRTRSGAVINRPLQNLKPSTPHLEKSRPIARSRPKKAKKEKKEAKHMHLSAPLSELTKDWPVPVVDIEAYVNRSVAVRRAEVETGKTPGKVKRPMNSFMLYRKAYQNRTKSWCLQNNHQVVSQVCGDSWPLEPESVREQFNEWARVERLNHQNAHPGYKFSPSKAGAKVAGKRKMEESEEEASDLEDFDWRGGRGSGSRKRQDQHVPEGSPFSGSSPYYGASRESSLGPNPYYGTNPSYNTQQLMYGQGSPQVNMYYGQSVQNGYMNGFPIEDIRMGGNPQLQVQTPQHLQQHYPSPHAHFAQHPMQQTPGQQHQMMLQAGQGSPGSQSQGPQVHVKIDPSLNAMAHNAVYGNSNVSVPLSQNHNGLQNVGDIGVFVADADYGNPVSRAWAAAADQEVNLQSEYPEYLSQGLDGGQGGGMESLNQPVIPGAAGLGNGLGGEVAVGEGWHVETLDQGGEFDQWMDEE